MEDAGLYRWGGWEAVAAGFVLFIAIGLVVSRLIQRPIRRMLGADERHRISGSIFVNLVRLLVWGTVTALILDECFGVDTAGIVSAMGIVGIAVSLGAQQTIANLIGGLIVSLSQTIAPGDWISVAGSPESRVVDTDWRSTMLEDEDGVRYIVPNSEMVSLTVAVGNAYQIVVIPFGLRLDVGDVGSILADCERVLLDALTRNRMNAGRKRPRATVVGTEKDSLRAEVKLYANREFGRHAVLRAVMPALIELLQRCEVLAGEG